MLPRSILYDDLSVFHLQFLAIPFQVIVPEMTGSIVGVYNGKVFTQVRLNMMNNPVKKSPPCKTHGLDSLCSLLCTYHGSEQSLCSQYGFLSCDGNSWQKWNKSYNFLVQNDALKTLTFPPSLEPAQILLVQVEVKPEMIGHYLGEFSISYKPVSIKGTKFSQVTDISPSSGEAR